MGLLSKLTVTVLNLLIAISLSFAEECTNRRVYIRNLPAQFNADLLHRQTLTNPFLSPNPLFPHLSFNGIGPKTHKRTHSWYRTDHRLIEPFFHRRLLEYPCLVSDHKSADAIFLPYYIGLDSLRFLYAPEDADFDVNGHGLDLFQFLIKDSPEIWKRRGGADHFLVSGRSSWDFSRSPLNREEWGTTFLESPEFFNVTVLTPEARRWPWQEQAIPYLTSFHPASLIRFQNWINRAHHSNRSTLMLFAGSGRGGGGTGGDKINIRRSLYEECDTQPESCTLIDCSNAKCSDEPTRFIHPMLHSTFCLHLGRFEESSRMERREIEQGDRELDEFEEAIRRDRNQGLFFKSLGDRKPQGPRNRKSRRSEMEQRKLRRLTERAAGSSARKTVYVSLMTLLAATVTANSVIAFPHISWNKTLPLCLLFLALLGQYVYEARLSSSLTETTTQLKQPENTQIN